MATIVVDELITKLTYQHDAQTVRAAEQAVAQLDESNKAAAQSSDKLAAENRKLAEQTDALTRAQIDLGEQIADSTAKTNKLKEEEKQLKESIEQAGGATGAQVRRLLELEEEIKAAEKHTRELREENARLGREKQKVGLEAKKVARAQKDVATQSRQTASAQRQLKDAMREATDKAREQGGAMDKLAEHIKGVAGGELAADAIKAIGAAIFELGKEIVVTGANFESLRARLKTVEGSNEAAAQSFSMITDFAKKTPFEVEDITTAFVQLRVRGINPTTEKLTALGDLTSAFGYGFEEMTDAIGAAARGELDPIEKFGIAAKIAGDKIKLSFRGQTEVVERSADAVTNVLVKWGQMEGIQGAMAEQSATTAGMFSNLKDTVSALFDQIAQMGVLDEVKLLMQAVSESIGGNDGLARVIADVLIIALRSVRELFTSMPQETLINFLQQLVTLVGMLVETLVSAATEQAGLGATFFEFATLLLEVANGIYGLLQSLDELKERFSGIPGPLDLIIKGVQLLLLPFELLGKALLYLLDLLDPFIDKLGNLADQLPSFGDMFSTVAAAVSGLARDLGLLNDELAGTKSAYDLAREAMEQFNKAQEDRYRRMSTEELTKLRQEGDALADAELARRRDLNTTAEKQEEAAAAQKTAGEATAKKIDRLLDNPKRLTDKQLAAIVAGQGMQGIDPKQAAKLRDKAQKEIDRRANKNTADGKKAAAKLNKSLLTYDIDKQLDELAKAAGQRAAARAIQRSGGRLSEEDVNDIELAERKAVKARLARRYEETGELPPGLAMDLQQTAALPNIEDVGGRLAPPVITVNNYRIEVTGNTFTAEVNVAGGVSATPGQVADAVVTTAAPVTYQGLARAIQNQLTNER